MTLAPGTRLGPDEIVEPIGKGGMDEVYRARDTQSARELRARAPRRRQTLDNRGRFTDRWRTASCWRRVRFSGPNVNRLWASIRKKAQIEDVRLHDLRHKCERGYQ